MKEKKILTEVKTWITEYLEIPNEKEGWKYFSVGPPYILERDDMLRLSNTWTTFVPRVYEGYPYLLAEMYAYLIKR